MVLDPLFGSFVKASVFIAVHDYNATHLAGLRPSLIMTVSRASGPQQMLAPTHQSVIEDTHQSVVEDTVLPILIVNHDEGLAHGRAVQSWRVYAYEWAWAGCLCGGPGVSS